MWPIFLALHVIGLTGYNLVLRRSLVLKADRWLLATIMQTGVAIPIFAVAFIKPPHLGDYNAGVVIQILITVVLVIALHLTNVMSLNHLEAGVYSILFNTRIIFTTFFGIALLHEAVIPLQIVGGVLIFLSVLTLRTKSRTQIALVGLQWGLAAALTISVLNLSEKALVGKIGYLAYAIPTMIIATIIMWLVLYIRKGTVSRKMVFNRQTLVLMVLRAISAHGALLALTYGATLTIYTYVSSLSVVLTVLFGILLLNERSHLKARLTAAGIAFIGLTCILIAHLRT